MQEYKCDQCVHLVAVVGLLVEPRDLNQIL